MQLTFIPGLARGGATRLQIEAVRVRSDLRGKGLGGAMMMWAIAEGRRRGAKLVQLTSDGSRVVAQLAASITFLLSDDGTNINGTILASDGGWSAL